MAVKMIQPLGKGKGGKSQSFVQNDQEDRRRHDEKHGIGKKKRET